jgi:hypothetical protein
MRIASGVARRRATREGGFIFCFSKLRVKQLPKGLPSIPYIPEEFYKSSDRKIRVKQAHTTGSILYVTILCFVVALHNPSELDTTH